MYSLDELKLIKNSLIEIKSEDKKVDKLITKTSLFIEQLELQEEFRKKALEIQNKQKELESSDK